MLQRLTLAKTMSLNWRMIQRTRLTLPTMKKRAHCMGPPSRYAGREGTRAVLVRLHDYTDKQRTLQAARNKGALNIEDSNVSFYQNFSMEVVRKRKESANARKQLREAGIRYSFLYPAVIKVFHLDGTSSTIKEINDYIGKITTSK